MGERNQRCVWRVMIEPRKFMREFNPSLSRFNWLIAWLLGTVILFSKAFAFTLGATYSLSGIALFAIVFGIPVGYLMIYLYSFLLYWTGKVFRGQATFCQIKDAYVWTRILEVFPLISWVSLMALFGRDAFTPLFLSDESYSLIIVGLIGLQGIFQVWETIILFHTLGEVQKLSAWITIWNVLFASVLLLIIDGSINWVISSNTVVGSFNMIGSLFYR